MCGKTGQLFIASTVQGRELNTDEEVKGGEVGALMRTYFVLAV